MKTLLTRPTIMLTLLQFSFSVFCLHSIVFADNAVPDEPSHSSGKSSATSAGAAASKRPVIAEGYRERPLAYDEVRPAGVLGDRVQLSLDKLIRDRDMHTGYATWGADQIGRWLGAVVVMSEISDRNNDNVLRPKVAELIAAQSPAGVYYGDKLVSDLSDDNVMRVWFGQGRGLWNLLEYYSITGDQSALDSVYRAADATVVDQATIKRIRPFWGDVNTTAGISAGIESGLGAMAILGQMSNNDAYIEYARYLADNMPIHVGTPTNGVRDGTAPTDLVKFEGIHNEHHTHSYLSITQGLVDLFVTTGDPKYLSQAQGIFEETLPSVWVNGDIPEGYGQVYEHRDEVCSVVDWILLSLKLFDATSDVRYMHVAELSILNELLQGQEFQGGFTCYRSLDRRHWMDESNYGGVQQSCCAMHGGLALSYAATHTVTKGENGLSVNLPLDVDIDLKDSEVTMSQRIKVEPHTLIQTLDVANGDKTELPLRIRIPYWCKDASIKVDGQPINLDVEQGFAKVTCPADAETKIAVTLPMSLTVVPARTNIFTMAKGPVNGDADELALQYGPFALMLYREMYPEIKEREFSLTMLVNSKDEPTVTLDPPAKWRSAGAYNLFVKARAGEKREVTLTPCGNAAMAPFTVVDPYVLRFDSITLEN